VTAHLEAREIAELKERAEMKDVVCERMRRLLSELLMLLNFRDESSDLWGAVEALREELAAAEAVRSVSRALSQVLEVAYLHPDLCQEVARAAVRHTIPDLKMTITHLETQVRDLSLQVESAARDKVALAVLEADKSRFQRILDKQCSDVAGLQAQVKRLQEQEHKGGGGGGLGGFSIKWRSGVGGLAHIASCGEARVPPLPRGTSGVIMPTSSSRRRANVVKMRASEFRDWNAASEDARERTSGLERSSLDSGAGDTEGIVVRCFMNRPVTGQRLPLSSRRQEQHSCRIKLELLQLDDKSSPACPRSCNIPSVFKATCQEEKIAIPRDMDWIS